MLIKYTELEIDHLLILEEESKVFIAARQRDSGNYFLFLLNKTTGGVYVRDKEDSWQSLFGPERNTIIARFIAACNQDIPSYHIRTNSVLTELVN